MQDRVTLAATWGIVTQEEIREAAELLRNLYEQSSATSILHWVDMRGAREYPPNVRDMALLAQPIQHPKLKYMIVITTDATLRLVGNAMMRHERRGFKAFLTPQSGLAYLARLDPTLELPTAAAYEAIINRWYKGED